MIRAISLIAVSSMLACARERPASTAAQQPPPSATDKRLTLVSSGCTYFGSVGWGDCYHCAVGQVAAGAWSSAEASPCIEASAERKAWDELLASGKPLRMSFERTTQPYGNTSGMNTPEGYAELRDVAAETP